MEIKTTARATSRHAIHGGHQSEPTPVSDDDAGEARLLFVSIGLCQADLEAPAFSIPSLVESILKRLKAAGASSLVEMFLTRVSVYGAESGVGYEHAKMVNEAPFTTTYSVTFVRGYDMTDPAVQVLRRDDLIIHQHVDAQSVNFRVELPSTMSLDNPIVGARRVVGAILSLNN